MKITNKIKMIVLGVAAIATLGASSLAAPAAFAENALDKYTKTEVGDNSTVAGYELMDYLQIIINVALGLIGFIAVVMIIIGGVQYTTSSGDANKVTKAKNTIMYGVVGLVIALLAFAIVNFILSNVFAG